MRKEHEARMDGAMRLNINGCKAVLTWPSTTEEEPCDPDMADESSLSGYEQSVTIIQSNTASVVTDSQHVIEIDGEGENVSCMLRRIRQGNWYEREYL